LAVGDFESAFLVACYLGEEAAARKCLEKGVDPNVLDNRSFAAGFHAALTGNLDLLKLVLAWDNDNSYDDYCDPAWVDQHLSILV